MTKSQINKVGEKLRAPGLPDDDTLRRLQEIRSLYEPPMATVQALLKETLGIDATARLKTVNTIVEKLRREKTRLAEMQDIAGLRIVEEIGLDEQDALSNRIVALLPGAKVADRRKQPSHGYRAVHVIANVDGRFVEIQVRTRMQDLWAQAMERLADEVGREIRYGGTPAGEVAAFDKLMNVAEAVANLEESLEEVRRMEEGLPPAWRAPTEQRRLRLHRLRIKRVRARLREQSKAVRSILAGIASTEEIVP